MTLPHRHWIRTRKRKQSIAGLLRRRLVELWACKWFPFVLFAGVAVVIGGTVVYQVGWLNRWW